MQEVQPGRGAVRFGLFELDVRAGELRKQGVKLKLQEQPFQILNILLERPGELVTRTELREKIWPADTFVDFDHGLYNAVKRLRETLGDTADAPRFIETVPRRGYRFIAPVGGANGHTPSALPSVQQPAGTPEKTSTPLGIRLTIAAIGAALVLALLGTMAPKLGGLRDRMHSKVSSEEVRSVAVLPLTNLSGDAGQEYLSEGITDALITELSQISELRVLSRTTTIRYKNTDKPLPQVARELGVEGIVEGTVQRSGGRVRVTAQLIYGPADRPLWAMSYERDLRDVLRLEQDIAVNIAGEIRTTLTAQEQARLQRNQLPNAEAVEAYLQGRYYLNHIGRGAGAEDSRRAAECFQRAIASDPDFALAYTWLAETYDNSLSGPPNTMIPLEKSALARSLQLDPRLAKTHQLLGSIRFFYDWDWQDAGREFQRSIELDPNSAWTHNRYSLYLAVMGRREEAIREAQRARELDPGNEYLSETLALLGEYDQAIEALRKYLEFNPSDGFAHWMLYRAYSAKGVEQQANYELQQTWTLFGFKDVASSVRRANAVSGYRGAMQVSAGALEKLRARGVLVMPTEIARTYALLGEKEKGIEWLQRAYQDRDGGLVFVARGVEWKPFRSDRRFQEIVRRVGLPE
jgi:TolB-like protein/DNA-binding winged helix-turn-helix (wHTH) protein/lipoprotein NlpI